MVIGLLLAAAAFAGCIAICSLLSNRTPTAGFKVSEHAISSENAGKVTQLSCLGKGEISDVAYSPDGTLFAVASTIGIYLYDAEIFEVVDFLESDRWARSIAFSPDGVYLAFSTHDDVRLVRIADGSLVRTLVGPIRYEGSSPGGMGPVVFSPDGSYVASATDYAVHIWAVPNGTLIHTLDSSRGSDIVFSLDGAYLAEGGTYSVVNLWDISDGERRTLHTGLVNYIDYSPDGNYLASIENQSIHDNASVEYKAVVRLWRASDGELCAPPS